MLRKLLMKCPDNQSNRCGDRACPKRSVRTPEALVHRSTVNLANSGAIMLPQPPCPARQNKSGTSVSNPTTGAASGTKLRNPAQLCPLFTTFIVVSCSLQLAKTAMSISSGQAIWGSVGVVSPGDANNLPAGFPVRIRSRQVDHRQVRNLHAVGRIDYDRRRSLWHSTNEPRTNHLSHLISLCASSTTDFGSQKLS